MSIRKEQCNKVCRILDDVLANRPTERDSLIVAVRKAFEALELFGNSERLPSAQPEPCDDPRADVYYLAEKIGIHRLYALVVELRGEPEPCEDAQHILDYLDNVLHPLVSPEHWNVYSELHDMIAALPSAQPEIIRCKDCLMHGVCRFEQFLGLSGYCSQAERREEGGE